MELGPVRSWRRGFRGGAQSAKKEPEGRIIDVKNEYTIRNGPGLSDAAGGNIDLAVALNLGTAQASPLSPELYLNRELTWLSFNRRVLAEAEDERNPLLERVKFLAITASNLDEFFMKRIGGLKQQAAGGVQTLTLDGRTPQAQIAECLQEVRQQEQRQHEVLALLL